MAANITWKALLATTADEACVVTCDESALDDLARDPPRDTAVRIVRGNRCTTKERTLQEWAAALQFPSYFGNTWDAFEECLNDLEWLNARRTVVIVTQAHALLPRSPKDFATLLEILRLAQKETPVLTVFHCTRGKNSVLRERISAALGGASLRA